MKNQNFIFNILPLWIIILMPALLISGPFLSDLGLSLVAFLFLINSAKNNLKKYYDNYFADRVQKQKKSEALDD